jgi:hypothetical protein
MLRWCWRNSHCCGWNFPTVARRSIDHCSRKTRVRVDFPQSARRGKRCSAVYRVWRTRLWLQREHETSPVAA